MKIRVCRTALANLQQKKAIFRGKMSSARRIPLPRERDNTVNYCKKLKLKVNQQKKLNLTKIDNFLENFGINTKLLRLCGSQLKDPILQKKTFFK